MMSLMYALSGALLAFSASVSGMRGHTIALPARAPHKHANGLAAYNKALERWGGDVGAAEVLSRRSALQGRGDKLERLMAESHEAFFTVDIEIGTPGQKLPVLVDTGSSDVWVCWVKTRYSLEDNEFYRPDTCFNPVKSSTALKFLEAEWELTYSDGRKAGGEVAFETLELTPSLVLDRMTVQLADMVPEGLLGPRLSGLLGLAKDFPHSIHSHREMPTLKERIASMLPEDSRYLSIDLRGGPSAGGYFLGYVEEALYEGNLTWLESDSEFGYWASSFWTVPVTKFGMGDESGSAGDRLDGVEQTPFEAVIHTATSQLLLPSNVTGAYWFSIPDAMYDGSLGLWIIPCMQADELPDLRLNIGTGYEAVIPSKLLVSSNIIDEEYEPGDDDGDENNEEEEEWDELKRVYGGMCYGALQSSDMLEIAVLGDPFLRSQFVVLGLEDHRIGLAKKIPNDSSD